jgi:hypothetical protein
VANGNWTTVAPGHRRSGRGHGAAGGDLGVAGINVAYDVPQDRLEYLETQIAGYFQVRVISPASRHVTSASS